jgi:hypothetical protein
MRFARVKCGVQRGTTAKQNGSEILGAGRGNQFSVSVIACGYTSSMETEVQNFKGLIQAIKNALR